MAAADFNDPFWVAIAAAAPVIGLASVVSLERVIRSRERYTELVAKQGQTPVPGYPQLAFYASYGNVLLQTFVLFAALTSLDQQADRWTRSTATTATVVGMVLVLCAPALASPIMRKRIDHLLKRRSRP